MEKKRSIHQEHVHVVRQTELARRVRLVLIPAVIVLLPLLAGLLTHHLFGKEERALAQHINTLDDEVAELRSDLDRAEQMRANAEVASEVDQQAIEDLRKELVSWSEKYGQQEEKVKFYQSLMDPNPTNSGVYLESIEITATKEEGLFDYKILLAQRASNHARITGSVQLELLSKKNSDGIQSISLNKLTGELDEFSLEFKFFQQFDGSLRVPVGFDPDQIKLVVKTTGNSSTQFEELVDWVVQF